MNDLPSIPTGRHQAFRVSTTLRRTEAVPDRVLLVGSCFGADLLPFFQARGVATDYVICNNAADLPVEPPRPLAEYGIQIVQIAVRSILQETLYFPRFASAERFATVLDEACDRLEHLADAALRWSKESGILTFVMNFMTPQLYPLGRLGRRSDSRNLQHLFAALNQKLDSIVEAHANTHILDCDGLAASMGRRFVQDDLYTATNHGALLVDAVWEPDAQRLEPVSRLGSLFSSHREAYLGELVEEAVAGWRVARRHDEIKMVIVDLDDTIWRGVIVDDWRGAGHATEGYPVGLAEALLCLKARGIILAIVSKNDAKEIARVWPHVWYGRLSLDDFAVKRINWQPKQDNIAEIIGTVNVRAESVLFIDDNPVERESVQRAFPGIRTMGGEPYTWRHTLLTAPELEVAHITAESARRTTMIAAQGVREAARQRTSRAEFLASLDVRVATTWVTSHEDPPFERAVELINKTNQFNSNGERRSADHLRTMIDAGARLLVFSVTDRFIDYGIVGVAILLGSSIDQFVMSCRVIGLEVEDCVIATIASEMAAAGHATMTARTRDTGLNYLSLQMFPRLGFAEQSGTWSRPTTLPPVC